MADRDNVFIEIESCQLCEKGQAVSGDVCQQCRLGRRSVTVVANGSGSGVRANIMAEVVASMAMNYTIADEPIERTSGIILRTFVEGSGAKASDLSFCIIDIRHDGNAVIALYGNTRVMLFRGSRTVEMKMLSADAGLEGLYTYNFLPVAEDRLVVVTEGILQSGHLTRRMTGGWGIDGVEELCLKSIKAEPTVSAYKLSRKIVSQAEINDLFSPRNDMSCTSVYFRRPRRILVCTGPPFNENKDRILADMVDNYPGTRLICGGTTSRIIARELGREIHVVLKPDPAGLPPVARMQGVELITEGVLTLSKVKSLLEKYAGKEIAEKGTDGVVARMLGSHDRIDFVVGTRINPAHQDLELPMELELRRNLIKDLSKILQENYLKDVQVRYI